MKFQLWEIFFRDPRTLDEKLTNVKLTFTCLPLLLLWVLMIAFGMTYGIYVLAVLGVLLIGFTCIRFGVGAYKLLA